MNLNDPYFKLRPPEPTPPEDLCVCPGAPPIKLMCHFSYNPVHCMACGKEVEPDRLGITAQTAEVISFWRNLYDALDHLWLDSGDYEEWAAMELANLESFVNRRGREVQQALTKVRKCYYQYFQDQSKEDWSPPANCPSCSRPLMACEGGRTDQLVCESCLIVLH